VQELVDSLKQTYPTKQGEEKASILADLCWYNRTISSDSAIKYGRKALDFSNSIGYQKGVAQAYNDLGIISLDLTDYAKALSLFDSSLIIREKLKDTLGIAALYNKIGIVYQTKRDLPKALEAGLKALKIYEEKNLPFYAAYCLNNIAILYHDQNNYQKSIEYHRKVVKYRKQLGGGYDLGASYHNLGNVYYGNRNYQEGLAYYDTAISILNDFKDKDGYSACLSSMGSAYYQQNKINRALPYLEEAYAIRLKQGNKTYITSTQVNLAKCYTRLGNYKKSKLMLDSALATAKGLGIKEHIKQGYFALSEFYQAVGDYKQAHECIQYYSLYSDSIINESINETVAEMQTKFDTEKKEQEINRLSQEKRIQDLVIQEKNNQLLIIVLGLILLVIFSVVFYQIYRIKQERKMANALIEEQKKGLKAVILATENERQRIAKDLHDGIGQTLSGIKLGLSKFTTEVPKENRSEFENIVNIVDEACIEVRAISHEMMPKALKEKGLFSAIEDMLNKSLGLSEVKYTFEQIGIDTLRFDESLEIGLYRITQELVNNIIKHSGATKVDVQLSKTKKHLVLLVEDNGKGFKFDEKREGIGLVNMKTRANTFNGELNYETELDKGTIVTIRIPVNG